MESKKQTIKNNKQAISLIVLVITIIVMVILAGAIILTINNSGIINKSSEAVFKQNVKNYQSELSLYLADKLAEDSKYDYKTLIANNTTTPSIKDVISSISDTDVSKFEVLVGELKYVGDNELELKWCEELGIKTKNSPITEAEYNALYAKEIALALQYGEVIDGVYKIKDEYNSLKGGTAIPSDVISLAIPYGTTSIGEVAFGSCSYLKTIIIPDGVTSVGRDAFYNCTSLESITIPEGVTTIDNSAFNNCTNLVTIELPSTLTSIGEYTFSWCSSLENITVPENVTSIGMYAFSYCSSLKSITLPEKLTSIGQSVFEYCTALERISIPKGVTTLNVGMFDHCTSLKDVEMPSVIEIREVVFYNCTSLESIIIPTSVTHIYYDAFRYCTSLTSVYYRGTETQWNAITIYDGDGSDNSALLNATKIYNYVD